MKKSLIALAVLGAFAGSAAAQSSVTLYGVADMGLQDTNAPGSSAQLNSSATMNNGTSRWGLRGTEDLGGGLKAGFNFEAGLSLDNGATGQSGGNFWSRAAYMTLSGGFGELSMGRRLNPAFYTAAAWELTGAANYSAVVSQFGAVLAGIRTSDLLMYTSPNLSGFTIQVGTRLKGDNAPNDSTYDVSLRYGQGPLSIAANYNNGTGVPGAQKNKHVGASYKFGPVRVAAAWVDPAGTSKGFTLGGSVGVGAWVLTADFARDTDASDTDYVLEAKYNLSKRTFVYAAFLSDDDSKTGALGATPGNSRRGYGLGIRHNF